MTYAHEHLVIDGGRPVQLQADFDLSDVERMATEVAAAADLGLGTVVDAMPCDAGRNAAKLAELSRRTGVHVIAPTGLHHDRYYGPAHWRHRLSVDELADLFVADIDEGIDANDYCGPVVRRTAHRAGVIKVGRLDRRPVGRATGRRSRRPPRPTSGPAPRSSPIARRGTGALEQVRLLVDHGVDPAHVALEPRRQGRRPRLSPRAGRDRRRREYDGSFRWGDAPNGTLQLLELGGRGRHARPGRPGHGRRPPGLLRRVRWVGPGSTWLLDGFSRDARGGRAGCRRSDIVCSWPTRPARSPSPAPTRRDRWAQPLLTSVVGSHARPGWFVSAIAAADRGEFGPVDLRELYDDAVDVALRDQEDAGVDVVCDGEMRRAGFFTAEFYRHLTGVAALPPDRRLGAGGHDQQHRFAVLEPIAAPDGLGVVAEYRYAATRTTRPLKVTHPRAVHAVRPAADRTRRGLPRAPGRGRGVRADPARRAARRSSTPARRSSRSTTRRRPSTPTRRPTSRPCSTPRSSRSSGGSGSGAHLCFGNYEGRPLARRTYRPVFDAMLAFRVDELVLEFANRELAELELLADITAAGRDVAAGLIDVKNYHLETADEVAERIDAVLATGVPAERLTVVPDCGFSQTARWATVAKLRAMVAGRDLVLGR